MRITKQSALIENQIIMLDVNGIGILFAHWLTLSGETKRIDLNKL